MARARTNFDLSGTMLTRARETTDDEGGVDLPATSGEGRRAPFLLRFAVPAEGDSAGETIATKAQETYDDPG